MFRPTIRGSMLAAVVAAFAIVVGFSTATAREVKAAIQFGLAYLPMMVMDEDHILENEAKKRGVDGVKLTLVRVSGSTAVNDTLLSGNADMGVMGTPSLLIIWEKTKPSLAVKGMASMSSFPMILNTVNPNLKSVADITDKDRIALPASTSPQAMMLRLAAEKYFALVESKRFDTNIVALPHPEAMSALLSGTEVTGHFTNVPFSVFEMQNSRVRRILNSNELLGGSAT
jgi:NitT/TauT family transport system substrate-binding protein